MNLRTTKFWKRFTVCLIAAMLLSLIHISRGGHAENRRPDGKRKEYCTACEDPRIKPMKMSQFPARIFSGILVSNIKGGKENDSINSYNSNNCSTGHLADQFV